jgi:hypothetical protein
MTKAAAGIPVDDRIRWQAAARRELLRRQARKGAGRWFSDPNLFCEEAIIWPPGQGLTDYQQNCLSRLQTERMLCVRSLHGAGKTGVAAIAILWFAITREQAGLDWKVPTTASSWSQLTHFTWREVHKWAARLNWQALGREPFDPRSELQTTSLVLKNGLAFAFSSTQSEKAEGAHADPEGLLFVCDEAKAVAPATWDAMVGAFSQGRAYSLAISTPGRPEGRFFQIQSRQRGYEHWATRHISLEEAIRAGRVDPEWVATCKRQWGEESALYQNRVLGEFCQDASDAVIPLRWIEQANDRWLEWKDNGGELRTLDQVGCDIAGSGAAFNVLGLRQGEVLCELQPFKEPDTMKTCGRIAALLQAHRGATACIDEIGIGAGLTHRLQEQGLKVYPFNSSKAATDLFDYSGELGFTNLRSAAWWNLRDLLDPANGCNIALPPDSEIEGSDDATLTGDLCAPKFWYTSGGKIQIESKKDIAKRLGRSTDLGDAAVYSFWPCESEPEEAEWAVGTIIGRG